MHQKPAVEPPKATAPDRPSAAPCAVGAPGPVPSARRPSGEVHDALSGPLARAVSGRSDGALLARWRAAPANWPINSSKPPTKAFTENGSPPRGEAFVNRGTKRNKQWYRWDGEAWVASGPPGETQQIAADTPGEQEKVAADTPDTSPPEIELQQPVEELQPLAPPFELDEHLAELPDMALASSFESMSLGEVREMRLVSRRFERVASFVLRRRMREAIKKTALSSLGGTLCNDLAGHLARLNPDEVFVLSDQVTPSVIEQITGNNSFRYLYQPPQEQRVGRGGRPYWITPRPYQVTAYNPGIQTHVYGGEHGQGNRTQIPVGEQHGQLDYVQQLHGPDPSGSSKMHVKSMIGSKDDRPVFVETGSANLTASAMQNNTESVVLLESPGIAKMFKQYAGEVVAGHKQSDNPEFSSALAGFNKRNPIGIRAALAPFVNVGEQLTTELKGADQVLVRMFLVSDAKQGIHNQPLQALCELARQGVDVTVVVDSGQSGESYVTDALDKLERAGATVRVETGPGGGGIMHDKLVFAHYPGAARATDMDLPTPERWTVMVGSSGLTRNVIQNQNYENLLIIDDDVLFFELLGHDTAARANTTYVTERNETD